MVETAEAKQLSRAASSLLFPELDFGVADNGTYPSEDFYRVLARLAFDTTSDARVSILYTQIFIPT
jgi:hypothetical protein